MSKLQLFFKFLDCKLGSLIINQISNEQLFALIATLVSKLLNNDELALKLVNLIHDIVKEEPIAPMLMDPEVRAILISLCESDQTEITDERI